MTPEGKVKVKVRALLRKYEIYVFMPVQMGIGAAGLDFHCVARYALAFFIETKAPGGHPTARQRLLINKLQEMGSRVFIVSDEVTLQELEDWLDEHAYRRAET